MPFGAPIGPAPRRICNMPRQALTLYCMAAPLALRSLPLFNVLSAAEIRQLAPLLQSGLAAPETTLIAAGAKRPALIVVIQGQLSLSRPYQAGRTLRLEKRTGPCIVGETEMLAARPALVEVRTQTAIQYVAMSADVIDTLLGEQRPCIEKIIREVVAHMRDYSCLLESRLKQLCAHRPLREPRRRLPLRRVTACDGLQKQ